MISKAERLLRLAKRKAKHERRRLYARKKLRLATEPIKIRERRRVLELKRLVKLRKKNEKKA